MSNELKTMLTASVEESPLKDVDPQSLQRLFDRINAKIIDGIPEAITDDEIEPLVAALRLRMAQFNAEQQASPRAKRRTKGNQIPDEAEFESLESDTGKALDDL